MIGTKQTFRALAVFACALAVSGPASAQGDRPTETAEGLKLVSSSDAGAFYLRPGTTLSEYENAELLAAYVAVDENWVKDYNRQAMRSRRLRDKNLQEIKTRVADDFWDVFGGDFFGAGVFQETQDQVPSKLIIRPAILDVSLASVDVSGDAVVQNFDSDANGKMTLVLEIYDASNSELIGRLFNMQTVGGIPDFGVESAATNRADERAVYKTWAREVAAEMKAN